MDKKIKKVACGLLIGNVLGATGAYLTGTSMDSILLVVFVTMTMGTFIIINFNIKLTPNN